MVKNYRELNILFCGFNSNEFNRMSACDTAKEILDILEATYKGTSQV